MTLKLDNGVGIPGCCEISLWNSGVMNLRARSDDDAVGLRIGAVAGIARRIEEAGAIACC